MECTGIPVISDVGRDRAGRIVFARRDRARPQARADRQVQPDGARQRHRSARSMPIGCTTMVVDALAHADKPGSTADHAPRSARAEQRSSAGCDIKVVIDFAPMRPRRRRTCVKRSENLRGRTKPLRRHDHRGPRPDRRPPGGRAGTRRSTTGCAGRASIPTLLCSAPGPRGSRLADSRDGGARDAALSRPHADPRDAFERARAVTPVFGWKLRGSHSNVVRLRPASARVTCVASWCCASGTGPSSPG